MSAPKEKSAKGSTKSYTAEEQNERRRQAKARQRHGRSVKGAPQENFSTGLQRERQEEARARFIEGLNKTVETATLILDEIVDDKFGRVREIADLVVNQFYLSSIESKSNRSVSFEDARKQVFNEVKVHYEKVEMVAYATYRGLEALKGAYAMMTSERELEVAVGIIKARDAARQQKVANAHQQATPERELVSA